MSDPIWLAEARKYLGLREIQGTRHEPGVVEFFKDSGNSWVQDDETAWCGAFVAAVFKRAGLPAVRPPGEKANALRAREWLNVGMPVERPKVGDLVIFWRGSKSGAQGHVGFYIGEDTDKILVLGGNQSNQVNISRYAKSRLLGFRRPVMAQPDDPGPEPEEPTETAPESRNPLAVVGALFAGAALYALRKPIGGLFRMAFREDGTTRAVGIALLVAIVAGIAALVLWAL